MSTITAIWSTAVTEAIRTGHRLQQEWNLWQRCAVYSVEDDGHRVPVAHFTNAEDARRAVACANACRGISTEDLELAAARKETALMIVPVPKVSAVTGEQLQNLVERIRAADVQINARRHAAAGSEGGAA